MKFLSFILLSFSCLNSFGALTSDEYVFLHAKNVVGSKDGYPVKNAFEIALNASKDLGINTIMTSKSGRTKTSVVEALLDTRFIFNGSIIGDDSKYNILTHDDILKFLNDRKNLNSIRYIESLGGSFNQLATGRPYGIVDLNNTDEIRPFRNFDEHTLIATTLYSCDLESTEYLIKKGYNSLFAFYSANELYEGGFGRAGDGVYNPHNIITPYFNFMNCLDFYGHWKENEQLEYDYVNYPENSPVTSYLENFTKKMIEYYLARKEINLNEFGCYPVVKSYAFQNYEWVRKMFTNKFGSNFASECERKKKEYDQSCDMVISNNGQRQILCSKREK